MYLTTLIIESNNCYFENTRMEPWKKLRNYNAKPYYYTATNNRNIDQKCGPQEGEILFEKDLVAAK